MIDTCASQHFVNRNAIQDWEPIVVKDVPLTVRTANGVVQTREAVIRYLPLLERWATCWVLENTGNLLSATALAKDPNGPKLEFRLDASGACFILASGEVI